MNLLTLLYILCLFVIFTPGIFFTLGKKGSVKSVFIHGLLFTLVVYISLEFILHRKVREGNTSDGNNYTLTIGDLGAVADKFGLTSSGDSGSMTSSGGSSTTGNIISNANSNCCNDLKNSFEDLSKKITDYQTTATNFNCTYKVEGSDFSSPVVDGETNTYTRGPVNANWNTVNGVIINKSNNTIVSQPAPMSMFNLNESSEGNQQSAVLQSNMDIFTTVNLNKGKYTLSFDAISTNSDAITIKLDKDNNPSTVNINATPSWTQITTPPVHISSSGEHILTFKNERQGTQIAFKNIIITKKD
jgi:hypothetical protein